MQEHAWNGMGLLLPFWNDPIRPSKGVIRSEAEMEWAWDGFPDPILGGIGLIAPPPWAIAFGQGGCVVLHQFRSEV